MSAATMNRPGPHIRDFRRFVGAMDRLGLSTEEGGSWGSRSLYVTVSFRSRWSGEIRFSEHAPSRSIDFSTWSGSGALSAARGNGLIPPGFDGITEDAIEFVIRECRLSLTRAGKRELARIAAARRRRAEKIAAAEKARKEWATAEAKRREDDMRGAKILARAYMHAAKMLWPEWTAKSDAGNAIRRAMDLTGQLDSVWHSVRGLRAAFLA